MKSHKGGGCCATVFGPWNRRDRSVQGNESSPNENRIDFLKEGRQQSQLSMYKIIYRGCQEIHSILVIFVLFNNLLKYSYFSGGLNN